MSYALHAPRVDRCKRCKAATVHHHMIDPHAVAWWACVECRTHRPMLTQRARELTPDEARADFDRFAHIDCEAP